MFRPFTRSSSGLFPKTGNILNCQEQMCFLYINIYMHIFIVNANTIIKTGKNLRFYIYYIAG
jgi:hypothetical protein